MSSPTIQSAYDADASGRFVEAGRLYWAAFEAKQPFDLKTTLRALFNFFDSNDPGVGAGHGLSVEEVKVANERFHALLDHLRSLNHADDAEVWRNWAGQLGMDCEYPLPAGALAEFVKRGSREAAWRLAAGSDRSPEVLLLVSQLRTELADETTFRSAYIQHMLRDLQVH